MRVCLLRLGPRRGCLGDDRWAWGGPWSSCLDGRLMARWDLGGRGEPFRIGISRIRVRWMRRLSNQRVKAASQGIDLIGL